MSKIVINNCYGGFSISKEAAEFMAARGNKQAKAELANSTGFYGYGYTEEFTDGYKRDDPDLVAAVEALEKDASGGCANLKVVDVPDGVAWEIEQYDGNEWVSEVHRTWG